MHTHENAFVLPIDRSYSYSILLAKKKKDITQYILLSQRIYTAFEL